MAGLSRFVGKPAPPLPFDPNARPATAPGEACEMCGVPIADEHSHVVGVENRRLLCACRPCYLLFTQDGAGRGTFRAVPDRYLSAPDSPLTDAQWDRLQVPVGMAYFFHNSALDRIVALYPSPAGPTESLLDLDAWGDVASANPLIGALTPDVEAIIVRRTPEGNECYLVPIDQCYELVGRMRLHWTGFDGGPEARRDIAEFFDRVRSRSRPVAPAAADA